MTDAGTQVETRPAAMNVQIAHPEQADKLMEGYAGFVNESESTAEERLIRLAGLAPVALQVMDEARDTIESARDELDEARRPKYVTKGEWKHGVLEIQHNTLVDLYRQWHAVSARIDAAEFAEEILDVFGAQVASAFTVYANQKENESGAE